MTPETPATLVLLHGLWGDRHDWSAVVALLGNSLPTLSLDLPGHGLAREDRIEGFSEAHRWLSHTLASHGVSRYCLAGYSLGGRLALYHASHAPTGLCGLWLESAHPGLSPKEREARLEHDKRWAVRFEREPLHRVLRDWYRQPVFADLDAAQRMQRQQRRLGNDGRAVAAMLRATSLGHQPDLAAWLARTQLPVAYLSGRDDAKFHALATRLATTCPQLEHHVLDSGHNLHAEVPQAVARLLSDWYARCMRYRSPHDPQ